MLADIPLLPFTESEARQLLTDKGVTDERVVQVILSVSGRLPLLVAMLAESQPADPRQVGDPTGSAVERFLKWESDPVRRSLAITAALPRTVNEDVVGVLIDSAGGGPVERGQLFAWLRSLPFVTAEAGRCTYHEVVRGAMLRLERTQSPSRWRDQHRALSAAYRRWGAETSPAGGWDDPAWRELELQAFYHQLCADPASALPGALAEGTRVLHTGDPSVAAQWLRAIRQAGDDADVDGIRDWGRRLGEALRGPIEEGAIACLSLLMSEHKIADQDLPLALTIRGIYQGQAEHLEEALNDLDQAIALAPDTPRALLSRGVVHVAMERYTEALDDFDRALHIQSDMIMARFLKGAVHIELERYEEGLAELSMITDADLENIEFDEVSLLHGVRGEAYLSVGRYEEAISEFSLVIDKAGESGWTRARRGSAYLHSGRHEEAVSELTKAIQLDQSENAWTIGLRGEAYQRLERYDEAIADLTRSVQLNPESVETFAALGESHRLNGNLEDALRDFTSALQIDPDYSWAIGRRGLAYRELGRHDEAIADFTSAIQLTPDPGTIYIDRGLSYYMTRRYTAAIADLSRGLQQDSSDSSALGVRGYAYLLTGCYDEALDDFTRAIQIANEFHLSLGRGEVFLQKEQYAEALADFTRSIQLDPTNSYGRCCRGVTYRALGRYDEALADISNAIELEPSVAWHHYQLALTHIWLAHPDQADRELRSAIDLLSDKLQAGQHELWEPYNLVTYHAAHGEYERAHELLALAMTIAPGAHFLTDTITDLTDLSKAPGLDAKEIGRLTAVLRRALAESPLWCWR
jgi:tetratricopeptide (TPR) repeat protein